MNITIASGYKAQSTYSSKSKLEKNNSKYNQNQIYQTNSLKSQSFGVSLPLFIKKHSIISKLKSLEYDLFNFETTEKELNDFHRQIKTIKSNVTSDSISVIGNLVKLKPKKNEPTTLSLYLSRLSELSQIIQKHPKAKALIEKAIENKNFTVEDIYKLFDNIPEFNEKSVEMNYRRYNGSDDDNVIINERLQKSLKQKAIFETQKQKLSSHLESLKNEIPDKLNFKEHEYEDSMSKYYIKEILENTNENTIPVITDLAKLIIAEDRLYIDLVNDFGDLNVFSEALNRYPHLVSESKKVLNYNQFNFEEIINLFKKPFRGTKEDIEIVENEVQEHLLKKALENEDFGCSSY